LGLKITHLPLITHTSSFLFSSLPLLHPLYHAHMQPAGGGGAPTRRSGRRRSSLARPAGGDRAPMRARPTAMLVPPR
jgi:hypothetical protein